MLSFNFETVSESECYMDCAGDCRVPCCNGLETPSRGKRFRDDTDLIDVVNDLQKKLSVSGHTLNVPLPQIVVVGSQSAGKSSVLESFVGREFLPRGKDTVTRRPTIVQMVPTQTEEHAVFSHKPQQKFSDFEDVKTEIENETRRHPGLTGFSADPITVTIYSPRVLKLTVVDLPGLIKNVEDGHDVSGIREVRNMVLDFIRPKESLILAVTPATQEIVTSDALEIAKEVDPKRERTIGILTKLDALSDGTDCRSVLENKKIYLNKGYVGVVNRNQKDIEECKDFPYILQKEKEFFSTHPAYKHLKDVMGIPYLTRMLQRTLRGHIKQFLPKLRNDITQTLVEYRKELKNFENNYSSPVGGKQFYLIKIIQNFIEDVNVQLVGNSELVNVEKFSAGAKINYILATEVQKKLTLNMVAEEAQTEIILVNMMGIRTPISLPTLTLDVLNRMLLQQYKGPMEEAVRIVQEILEEAVNDCAQKTALKHSPDHQKNVLYSVSLLKKIHECMQKQMVDIASKYIIYFLVKKVLNFIKVELLPSLLESSNSDSLTEDFEADFRWKEETENTCKVLQEALEAIKNF